jgi:hypothetical protein
MSDVVASSSRTVFDRLPKWTRTAAISFAVIVLMALSFTLGRATIDRARQVSPAIAPPVVQPAPPSTLAPELGCRHPGTC